MGFIKYPILCGKCKNKMTEDELEIDKKMCGDCFNKDCQYYEELERLELEEYLYEKMEEE